MREPVIRGHATMEARPAVTFEAYSHHAARGFGLAAAVFLLGTVVDLFILWVLQHQNQPQWEFIAITRTMEAFPRFTLAIALFYGALHFARSASLLWHRVLGAGMILLGLGAAGLGLLMVTDYLVLVNLASGQADVIASLRAGAAKSLLLSGTFALLLVPLGILALRQPRSS